MNEIDGSPMTDPVMPPQPAQDGAVWSVLRMAGAALVAGGVGLLLMSAAATETRGATRSCQLKWQQQQNQADQVIQAEQAAASEAEAK